VYYYRRTMAASSNFSNTVSIVVGVLVLGLIILAIVSYLQPNLFGASEGFKGTLSAASHSSQEAGQNAINGRVVEDEVKGNPDAVETPVGPADFGNADSPSGCYPRDQLTPSELLPKDANSVWAEQNPMGNGSLKGKNFLSAGALIGVNTVGQSLRNANQQIRSEPPNPQVPVSIFLNSTIEPDVNRRNLEIA
jgi:hypothetical protein